MCSDTFSQWSRQISGLMWLNLDAWWCQPGGCIQYRLKSPKKVCRNAIARQGRVTEIQVKKVHERLPLTGGQVFVSALKSCHYVRNYVRYKVKTITESWWLQWATRLQNGEDQEDILTMFNAMWNVDHVMSWLILIQSFGVLRLLIFTARQHSLLCKALY